MLSAIIALFDYFITVVLTGCHLYTFHFTRFLCEASGADACIYKHGFSCDNPTVFGYCITVCITRFCLCQEADTPSLIIGRISYSILFLCYNIIVSIITPDDCICHFAGDDEFCFKVKLKSVFINKTYRCLTCRLKVI